MSTKHNGMCAPRLAKESTQNPGENEENSMLKWLTLFILYPENHC